MYGKQYLICKKNLEYSDRNYYYGKQYAIYKIGYGTGDYFMLTDTSLFSSFDSTIGLWFCYDKVWEYFYTEKEYRKLKLEKLNVL